MSDYAARMVRYGISPKEQVAAAAADLAACWLDVRSQREQDEAPLPKVRARRVQCPVTMDDASALVAKAAQLLPEKDAPVICFCAVGGRAGVAKSALEAAGYSHVINAGGLSDVEALANTLTAEGRLAALGIEFPDLVPQGRYVPYVSDHKLHSRQRHCRLRSMCARRLINRTVVATVGAAPSWQHALRLWQLCPPPRDW